MQPKDIIKKVHSAPRLGVRTYDAIYEEQRAQCPQALIVRKDPDQEWTIVAGVDKWADGPPAPHAALGPFLFCFRRLYGDVRIYSV